MAPAQLINGAYFLDEDPYVFSAILLWLRHGLIDEKARGVDGFITASKEFIVVSRVFEVAFSIMDTARSLSGCPFLSSEFWDQQLMCQQLVWGRTLAYG